MEKLLVGNAPCSWGTLEFEESKGEQIPFRRMLDELAEAGYTGTELGDWGYMPTDPVVLKAELQKRGLVMLGAFVPVALKEPSAHEGGIASAVKTARLLAAVGGTPAPYLSGEPFNRCTHTALARPVAKMWHLSKTLLLGRGVGARPAPYLVLADDNGKNP
jgi:sugar phosphate isomerase/epimerase